MALQSLFPVVVVGCGNMGAALAKGLRAASPSGEIRLVEPDTARREALQSEGVGTGFADLSLALKGAATIVLAVKPQVFSATARALVGQLEPQAVVLSIMAGVPVRRLRDELQWTRVVRSMPNLPLTVGSGATAIATDDLPPEVIAQARVLLESAGQVVEVLESQLDAVTGLSGSGPAYVLKFLMSLEDAGVLSGLARPVSRTLALATLEGTLKMVRESGLEPDVLRGQVTSPGGTTIYGLKALEEGGFTASVLNAVLNATERSKQLGK